MISRLSSPLLILSLMLLGGCTATGMIAGAGMTTGTAAAQSRGLGDAVDDTAIRAEISHLYLQKNLDMFRTVSIDVMEGRVMLTGSVDKRETANAAVQMAWKPKGVKEVINEIETVGAEGIGSYAYDSYISGTIKGRMLLERDIRSINFTVETVNQKAYILGIARNQDELEKVATIASTTKYVNEVVMHVILQDDPRRGTHQTPQDHGQDAGSAAPRIYNNSYTGDQPLARPITSMTDTSSRPIETTGDAAARSSSMYGTSTGSTGNAGSGGVMSTDLPPPAGR